MRKKNANLLKLSRISHGYIFAPKETQRRKPNKKANFNPINN